MTENVLRGPSLFALKFHLNYQNIASRLFEAQSSDRLSQSHGNVCRQFWFPAKS